MDVLFMAIAGTVALLMVGLSGRGRVRVRLGWTLEFPPRPFTVDMVPGHVVLLGRTGSGKSNTAKVLAASVGGRVPVLVLDWAGEYDLPGFSRLRPGRDFSLNPLEVGRGDLEEHIDFIVDLFGDTLGFTEPQRYMFRNSLREAYARGEPTLADVLSALDRIPLRSYYDHETKVAIRRRLSHLVEGLAGEALSSSTITPDNLFRGRYVVDLSVFRSVHAKKLYTLLLLKMLYDHAVRRGITTRLMHVTVIEEAWNVIPYRRLDSEPSIGERLFAELRKYGECIVAVAQNPYDIAWSVLKNARMLVVHCIPGRDAEMLGVPREAASLRTGEAYVMVGGKVSRVRVRRYGGCALTYPEWPELDEDLLRCIGMLEEDLTRMERREG